MLTGNNEATANCYVDHVARRIYPRGCDLSCNPYYILTCVSHTAHVIDIGWTSVRLSVRLSVTRWYCVETAQPIVKLSSLPGSPMILVF